jgi:hypothetical protein
MQLHKKYSAAAHLTTCKGWTPLLRILHKHVKSMQCLSLQILTQQVTIKVRCSELLPRDVYTCALSTRSYEQGDRGTRGMLARNKGRTSGVARGAGGPSKCR